MTKVVICHPLCHNLEITIFLSYARPDLNFYTGSNPVISMSETFDVKNPDNGHG